jgi:hypothetical protein
MEFVGIYLGDDEYIPPYTEISLKQARYFNPHIEMHYICNAKQSYFDEINIKWIPTKSISSALLENFNEICWFKREGIPRTSYPSKPMFWHRTAERIFYLQAYMEMLNLENVFHFENDNLIYGSLEDIHVEENIKVLPMSPILTTFGFCYFPNHNKFKQLCSFMIDALHIGERALLSMGYDHISEMSLLNYSLRHGLVDLLPIIPRYCNVPFYKNAKNFIFDSAAYGQFLGGNNNGDGPGFMNCHSGYYSALALRNGDVKIEIKNMKPYIVDSLGKYYELFNLHLHRKELEKFAIPEVLQ